MPVVTPVVGAGFGRAVYRVTPARFLENPRWSLAALGVIVCTYGAGAIVAAKGRVWEETSLQLALIRDVSAVAPILAYRSAQAALPLLQADIICVRSSSRRSFMIQTPLRDLQKYLIWASDALKGLPEVWLLFSGEPESGARRIGGRGAEDRGGLETRRGSPSTRRGFIIALGLSLSKAPPKKRKASTEDGCAAMTRWKSRIPKSLHFILGARAVAATEKLVRGTKTRRLRLVGAIGIHASR